MNLELTETQTLIRDTARKFARERVAPQARTLDREETFSTALYQELASLGLMG
ncbi:MAG: acyl-CoA dehydrogenase family protein, partial [Cystobacter sp.]